MARKKLKKVKSTPFSRKIAALRKESGLTMTALSQLIAVTPSYISLLESGERQPSRKVVARMIELFFSPDQIHLIDEFLMMAGLSPRQVDKVLDHEFYSLRNEEKVPDSFEAFQEHLRTLIQKRKAKRVSELIQEGFQHFTEGFQIQILLSLLELSRHNYEAALKAQRMAMELYQEQEHQCESLYGAILLNLALCYASSAYQLWKQKEQDKTVAHLWQALHHYDDFLKLTPQSPVVQRHRAQIVIDLVELNPERATERLPATIGELKELLKLNLHQNGNAERSSKTTGYLLSTALAYQGKQEEAELLGAALVTHAPNHWENHQLKAQLYALKYKQTAEPNAREKALTLIELASSTQDYFPQGKETALIATLFK